MRGHERIIEMRQNRQKPAFVFINDFPCKTDWADWLGDHATIEIQPADRIEYMDLRFLIGCKVSVSAIVEERAKRLFKACIDAGATTVAACHVQRDRGQFDQAGWVEVHHG